MNLTEPAPLPEPPFSLELLLARYPSRRRRLLEPVYRDMLAEAQQLTQPRQVQRAFPAAHLPLLAGCLPGVDSIVLALCTLGPHLDARISVLFKEDPVAAVVLDELGTHWIRSVAQSLHGELQRQARAAGQRTTPSYRPGIGRWPLELQAKLFRYLPAADIGLSLLSETVMVPPKSISMIVGIGRRPGRPCYAPEQPAATPAQMQLLQGNSL
jgi:hypothetical protein